MNQFAGTEGSPTRFGLHIRVPEKGRRVVPAADTARKLPAEASLALGHQKRCGFYARGRRVGTGGEEIYRNKASGRRK